MQRGEYLAKIIEQKGYTLMSLSKESDVPYTTIKSMIERNLVNASIDNVYKICKTLEITMDSLYSQKDTKETEAKNVVTISKEELADIKSHLKYILEKLNK